MANSGSDQFLSETPVGINFDEEATKFFDPEEAEAGPPPASAAGGRVDLYR